jgi:nicotinamidase-related amidase
VVVDIQERLSSAMDRRDEVVASTLQLIRLAGLIQAPVIMTRQYPKGLGDADQPLLAELDALAQAGGHVEIVDKVAFCACGEQAFLAALEATARRQVVLVGMETHICIAQTALELTSRGFDVHVPADAVCSRRATDYDVALDRLRSAGVSVTTTESVMYEAVAEAATDEFRALLEIVKSRGA